MNNRIKDIFAAIHRPPVTGKRVLALSEGDAERIPLLPGVAMISIVNARSAPAILSSHEFLLRLRFSDVDFLAREITDRAKKKLGDAMTKEQALEVHQFVRGLPDSIHTLIVHCGAGISRSGGVASALNAIYGFEIEEQRLKRANQSVKKLLIDVAKTIGH
ncbi:hypothetical protein HWE04_20520 [Herbaspirillum sp. C7C2]|uniref:hypothetical protein n=1 Tax=Herbaspirillum sp. C7C2 TaxID=2736666 RepID=UPI001F521126|nr:hypothetical protein [Herbaspirillum sp. C7C2]MCI1016250.1 hypothetical protein [Herbaspirillum sp. C7C2]